MKSRYNVFIMASLVCVVTGYSCNARAGTGTCTYTKDRTATATVMAITTTAVLQGGNITVGPDTPNGTELFRQTLKADTANLGINCTVLPDNPYYEQISFFSNLPYKKSTYQGGSFAGYIYDTNVPGIGFVAWFSRRGFPYNRTVGPVTLGYTLYPNLAFDITLVKTGEVAADTVLGSALPTVAIDVTFDGDRQRWVTTNFSGQLNITSQSCTTPANIDVPMGTHEISQKFTGVGTTTDWVDATITLTNCPSFYGTINNGNNNYYSMDGTSGTGTPTPNNVQLILTPNTEIIDSAQGIMSVKKDSGSATGVGIQLAYGTVSSSGLNTVKFGTPANYPMTNSATQTTWSLPLKARYIQTNATMTAGTANATATYTINYY